MRRVVVIGGGIAGLAAAWAAHAAAGRVRGGLDVLVLERADDVGGKARTILRDGWLVEAGPTGFLSGRTEMDRLVTGAGLASEVVTANPAAAHRFIYHGGRMRRVAANPIGLVRSGLLSGRGALRLLADMVVPRRRGGGESIWDFAARRLGAEAADRLIAPMTLGVFAGDARRLSLVASFPQMAALEHDHGSLIRGLLARRGKMRSGTMTSFAGGMQELPRALATRGGFRVSCRSAVDGIARMQSGWEIRVGHAGATITADAIILALDSAPAAALLREHSPALAADLEAIPSPPVGVVALGYGPEARERIPNGFGVLIARGEGFRMLGNLWDSHLFPGRCPDGHVLIRAMYGGGVDPAAAMLPPGELAALARAEVARLYGIDAAPCFEQVVQWPRAIPQYELGHSARIARIDEATVALPGVFITGSALHGIAFPAAVAHGVQTGERVVEWLSVRTVDPHR